MVAVLGDDGRHHLRQGADLLCGVTDRRHPVQPGRHCHAQGCGWWSDSISYRINPPPVPVRSSSKVRAAVDAGHGRRTVWWSVALTDMVSAPEFVVRAEQCPGGGALWPAFHADATPMGRLRIRLAQEFGSTCQGCGRAPAAGIDHDHQTGLVRGLLCRFCNGNIDYCPHLRGCRWADYLNDPPAAALQLKFPRPKKPSGANHRARVEAVGFDLFI